MRFALVVLEKHAGAAVQLRNNHALGAVDDEGAFVRHQRHFAHVDFLLFNVLDDFGLAGGGFAVVNDKLHKRTHGGSVGERANLAFAHVKRRLAEFVFQELHLHKTIVRDDGEGGFKRCLQPLVLTLARRRVGLQKILVGIALHLQQVGHFQHAFARAKALADAFAFGKAVSHETSWRGFCVLKGRGRAAALHPACSLAAGHYQLLADGCALHAARTKGSLLQIKIRRHLKSLQ